MSDPMGLTGPPPESLNTHTFDTDRLTIGLPETSDANTLFDLIGGEHRREICATLMWDGPDEVSETREWIKKANTLTFEDFGFHWVVRDRGGALTGEAGRPMGAIGTRPRSEPGRADVGYWLGRPHWGRGIMKEALGALLEYGFGTLDFYRMEAQVFTQNERGLRLVEGVGMIREGTVRRATRKYGEFVDIAIYGMLRPGTH